MGHKPDIKRGDVYYVERMPTFGHEQRTGRPAVVVSNNYSNRHNSVVEVVFLTTQPKLELPTHVIIHATGVPSTALCEQVQTVDSSRLGNYCGTLSKAEIHSIDEALAVSLGIQYGGSTEESDAGSADARAVEAEARCSVLQEMYNALLNKLVGQNN